MGNNEPGTPSKSEKAASPVQEHTNIHAYPDWAAIQAYYGPGVTLPPPYFNSGVPSGHAPHPYMWAPPQHMMPPYGAPYAAIYSHGGVYAHPSVPLVVSPLSIETPAKSSGNKDRGLMKKLKGFDGLAVSIGNGNAESAVSDAVHGLSQSGEYGTEGSSDGSDGNTAGRDQTRRKRSCENMQSTGKGGKVDTQNRPVPGVDSNAASRALGVMVAPVSVAGKSVGTAPLSGMNPAMELGGSPSGKAKTNATTVPPVPGAVPAHDALPSELWIQDERELKRERRKQSNRESARRSRLRKQAESEELAMKVESLNVENMALKSEINRLEEKSEKLRLENATLKGKLKNPQLGQLGEIDSGENEVQGTPPLSTENFLSRVASSGSDSRSSQRDSESHENSNSGTKLHQLLESNPRADAVAAG